MKSNILSLFVKTDEDVNVGLMNSHQNSLNEIREVMAKNKEKSLPQIVAETLHIVGKEVNESELLNHLGENGLLTSESLDEISVIEDESFKYDKKDFDKVLGNVSSVVERVYGLTPYDEQLVAIKELLSARIIEQKTGEGKTLVASIASVVSALFRFNIHVITTNQYLSLRDGNLTKDLANQFLIPVGIVRDDMGIHEKQANYACPIVYTTHTNLGFDYLRDNLIINPSDKVQVQGLNFVIVDEADNILIDDARTPLIIAGESKLTEEDIDLLKKVDNAVSHVSKEEVVVNQKHESVNLTSAGIDYVSKELGLKDNIYSVGNEKLLKLVEQALQAHFLRFENVDYVVTKPVIDESTGEVKKASQIELIDESTGRILEGRRYSNGLHSAIEVKHGLTPQGDSETVAQITYQELFNLYQTIAGMTGTAHPEDDEFYTVYGLEITTIPTHKPIARIDKGDVLFATEEDKFNAVVNKIIEVNKIGRPILVGTTSVEDSEQLSKKLQEKGIAHNVLNATNHAQEAQIVAEAGKTGSVTIATNMAGRGTDIKLDEEAKRLGGLIVIGTNHNRSKRIDDQLRGRSGRQGDDGVSQFYISLEDELMKGFANDSVKKNLAKLIDRQADKYLDLGSNSTHRRLAKQIRHLQEESETMDSSSRKFTFRFSNILSNYRTQLYALRDELLNTTIDELKEVLVEKIYTQSWYKKFVKELIQSNSNTNVEAVRKVVKDNFPEWNDEQVLVATNYLSLANNERDVAKLIVNYVFEVLDKKAEQASVSEEAKSYMVHTVVVKAFDFAYSKFLVQTDILRQDASLRGYAGQDTFAVFLNSSQRVFNETLEKALRDALVQVLEVEIINNIPQEENYGDEESSESKLLNELFEDVTESYKDGSSAPSAIAKAVDSILEAPHKNENSKQNRAQRRLQAQKEKENTGLNVDEISQLTPEEIRDKVADTFGINRSKSKRAKRNQLAKKRKKRKK